MLRNASVKLFAVLVISLLVGCSHLENPEANPNSTVTSFTEVTPSTSTVEVGKSVTLTLAIRDVRGVIEVIAGTPVWSSDPTGFVSIAASSADGYKINVTGLKAGQTTIRMLMQQMIVGSNPITLTGAAVVNVTAAPVVATRLDIIPSSLELSIEETGGITCAAFDAQGTPLTTLPLQWTTSASGVAEVNGGNVTGIASGQATITCREPASGLSKTAQVIVHPRVVKVNAVSLMAVGGQQFVIANVTDFRGKDALPVKAVVWSSDNGAVATVASDPASLRGTHAQVTAVGAGGPVHITATLSTGESGAADITVYAPAPTSCGPIPATLTVTSQVVTDPGNLASTINLPGTLQVDVKNPGTPGNWQFTTVSEYVRHLNVAASPTNGCTIPFNPTYGFFSVGTKLYKEKVEGTYPASGGFVWTYSIYAYDRTQADELGALLVQYKLTKS